MDFKIFKKFRHPCCTDNRFLPLRNAGNEVSRSQTGDKKMFPLFVEIIRNPTSPIDLADHLHELVGVRPDVLQEVDCELGRLFARVHEAHGSAPRSGCRIPWCLVEKVKLMLNCVKGTSSIVVTKWHTGGAPVCHFFQRQSAIVRLHFQHF